MREKIQEISKMLNHSEQRWYALKQDFEKILGSKSATELIDELEGSLHTFPKGDKPHYCLVFYLALIILIPENQWKQVVTYVKTKKSYSLMQAGLKILLESKFENFKYEGKLNDEGYRNKYEFLNFFRGFAPDYEMGFRGYLNLLELIYEENPETFWQILDCDRQNVIFLRFMVNSRLSFTYAELISILLSDDELRANGAFFYIMNHFLFLISKSKYDQTEESEKLLHVEINRIHEVFTKLSIKRRIHFIVNFLFAENGTYPGFFVEELQAADIQIVIRELDKMELDNLYKLVRIYKILYVLKRDEIEQVFVRSFIEWVHNDANPYVWEGCKQAVEKILNLLSEKTLAELLKVLTNYKDTLFVSSFDRQVRYGYFLKEEGKLKVIEDVLSF